MGLELQHILSEESHYGTFECAICHSLVDLDALVTTTCAHCFCRKCLSQWLEREQHDDFGRRIAVAPTCPTCNQDLLFATSSSKQQQHHAATMMIGEHAVYVHPLLTSQPLAHRVLHRIQVSCPLQGVSCQWKGDYGDLQQHLLSSTAHTDDANAERSAGSMEVDGDSDRESSSVHDKEARVLQQKRMMAQSFKEQANSKFSSGHYLEARDLYSKAISVLQHDATSNSAALLDKETEKLVATLYSNRAATQLVLKDYSQAEGDASMAIAIDPTYIKAYIRKAKALTANGNFSRAISSLQEGIEAVPNSNALEKELQRISRIEQQMAEGLSFLEAHEFSSAKATFGRLLKETEAPNVLLGAARADLGLGLTDSTLRLTLQVLKKYPQSSEGCCVRGHCYLLMFELESGVKLLKEAMRMDPDSTSTRVLLKEGLKLQSLTRQIKEASFHRRFDETVQLCTQAIEASQLLPPRSPLYGWLHTERAKANLRLKAYALVLKDCALVLYHTEDHVEAWLVRFSALHGQGHHEEALAQTTELLQKWGASDERIRKAHEKADFEVRKSKRPDFYKLLGVSSIASEREIKKAYRQRALDLHPDRFAGKEGCTEQQQKQAQKDFQLLGQALEVLTDEFKKQLWDEGYDLEAIQERVEAAKRAAHHHGGHNPHWRH